MTDQQNRGARAPPVPVGQVAPEPNANEQHSGAAAEVAAEAELRRQVAERLAAQPVLITPTAKSKAFTSRETLLYSVFQGFKPLTDDSKKGAELKLVNDINRRAGSFARSKVSSLVLRIYSKESTNACSPKLLKARWCSTNCIRPCRREQVCPRRSRKLHTCST